MRRLKIGIRPQLIVLVCFASLFSLLILAIVTGVYFSTNLSNLRKERLEVIAQLKATQVAQAIQYISYQVLWLTNVETITTPLSQYKAGNNSVEIFNGAQQTLDQLMGSTELFAGARLYNLDLQIMASSYSNSTLVSNPTLSALFPLNQNSTIPASLLSTSSSGAFFTGPIANKSEAPDLAYFMGITIPVVSNSSIIIDEPSISGYLTVIASAENIKDALNTNGSTQDYQALAVKPIYGNVNISSNETQIRPIGFETVFQVDNSLLVPGNIYSITASSSIRVAIETSTGSSTNVESYSGKKVAIGFTPLTIGETTWIIIVVQKRSVFMGPINTLKRIIIGVVIGIGVFMCLITFPLAVWFIRPITKLKLATEAITRYKKEKGNGGSRHSNENNYDSIPLVAGSNKHGSRSNSINSTTTGTSNSIYSTGILLPDRIPRSKKFFKDELTELSEAFNIMTEELDKQYTHLEDRVKLRTKELEASKIEAEAANEAKTVFIANISHELRTPLNGILGMTSIAMDDEDQTRIQDSLKLIHRSGELLLHILTELLTYSKNTLNRSKLEKSNFQILEIVYQIKSIFNKLAQDQRVNFKILVRPNFFRKLIIYGDSNRIIQIVMNLVSNSLKFTPVDGSVDVTFKILGEYDLEASQKDNFTKVHILDDPATTTTTNASNISISSKRKNIFTRNKKHREATSKNKHQDILDQDDDAISIITLSTQEYENKIFESQFNNKSLPDIPMVSSSSEEAHSKDSSIIEEKVQSISSGTESTSHSLDEKQPVRSPSPKQKPEESSSSSSSPSRRQQINIMPQSDFKGYPTLEKQPVIDTINISNNEIIKNNKSYSMKKLYNPKTWVIQIEVCDTGPGIEPALQDKVFEPFVQGDQTLSRSYGGTGLGLSICRQLATMMKGTLSLKSTIGQGSTFTLTIPLPQTGEIIVEPEELQEFYDDEFNPNAKVNRRVVFDEVDHEIGNERSKEEEQEQHPGEESTKFASKPFECSKQPPLYSRSSTGTANSGSGESRKSTNEHSNGLLDEISHLKILVAEDNLVNQEVIRRMLKLEGFNNITMACNGAEAISHVKESIEGQDVFDLIFMDIQMPKIDGLLATKMIRNNLHYTNPIIALTAFADESNVRECLNNGMSGFLSKPIRRTNLRKIIVEFSPILLTEVVTTPQTHHSNEEKQLGYGSSYVAPSSHESPPTIEEQE
ncbi:Histidine protein kinase SLN1 [Spathaspora sp. JA1]|nr:Histidine protein kinase SLN1 [Spathaspora sp. JA1]